MYYRARNPENLFEWAFHQKVGAVAKLVLVEMVLQCDNPFLQVAFSNKAAARKLLVAVNTVRRAIAELEKGALISYRGTKPLDDHRYLKIWKLEYD